MSDQGSIDATGGGTISRPLAYTVAEAAALLRVSDSLIRSMVRAGALPRIAGLGKVIRIPSRALFELVGEPVPPVAEPNPSLPQLSYESGEPAAPPRIRHPAVESVRRTPRLVARGPYGRSTRSTQPRQGPVRAGTRSLWLLADSSVYSLMTWHLGEDAALCGKSPGGRWRREEKRSPAATMCPRCLTAVFQIPEIETAAIPIGKVCMLRQTSRGGTTTALRSGWHLGNGRTTSCGKREGPWSLTEREPRAPMCFVCLERRRWEREKIPGSIESLGVGNAQWTVLVDTGLDAPEVEQLILQAPSFFAARRAERSVARVDFDDYGKGTRELFADGTPITRAVVSAPQWAPGLIVSATPASSLEGDSKYRRSLTPAEFIERMSPAVERELKVQELRRRWVREADPGKRLARGRSGAT